MAKKMRQIKITTIQMKIILFFVLILTRITGQAQSLTLAVAANFRDPMTEIVRQFREENPDIPVRTVFGSSGSLYQQITQHAPFDIFFAANMSYPQKAFEEGLSYGASKIYAIGQLILWSKDLDVNQSLDILATDQLNKLAVANPALAPYGESAVACLKHYNLYDQIKDKLVIADNISQTAQFAATGNTDAGLLAMSQLHSKSIQGKGTFYVIPPESYPPIQQGYVIIRREENESIARKFISFMQTEQVKQIILDYGYRIDE